MSRPLSHAVGLLVSIIGAAAHPVAAQILEVPDFTVGSATFSEHLQDIDVAVAPDGTITFIWGEYDLSGGNGQDKAATRRFSADGTPLGPPVRADSSGHVFNPKISPDTRGGFVTAWQWIISGEDYSFFGRRLDGQGIGVGPDFEVDVNLGPVENGAVAGLPSGAVYVWRQANKLWGTLYDPAGQLRGAAFTIGDVGAGFDVDVDAMPDGGFVAAWTNTYDANDVLSWGRVYDATGQPRGAAFPIGDDMRVEHVAANPLGGIAAAGTRWNLDLNNAEVWLHFFDDDGTARSENLVEIPNIGVSTAPDLVFDQQGNVLVVWSEYRFQEGELLRPRARALGPTGTPLGLGFWVAFDPAAEIRTARLPNGTFVNAWYRNGTAFANVVSFGTTPSAVCGNDVLEPFEECDDGDANSDTLPDACRTNCRRPRCGDDVTDTVEACDDGNGQACDGCSPGCDAIEVGFVCGDGVRLPACEQCDDSNGTTGDGCSVCRVERILGGGSYRSDCYSEWSVANASNSPMFDSHGGFNRKQRCTDNDPRCDFDGGTPETCTFRVRVCARDTYYGSCVPGPVAHWELRTPSANKALKVPAYAATRTALAAAVAPLVGNTAPDSCSEEASVEVPLRGIPGSYRPGKLTLKAIAELASGETDKDTLKLACLPAPAP